MTWMTSENTTNKPNHEPLSGSLDQNTQLKYSAYFAPHSWGLLIWVHSHSFTVKHLQCTIALAKRCLLKGHEESLHPSLTLSCTQQPLSSPNSSNTTGSNKPPGLTVSSLQMLQSPQLLAIHGTPVHHRLQSWCMGNPGALHQVQVNSCSTHFLLPH